MDNQRLQVISTEVLQIISPRSEALDSAEALKKKLRSIHKTPRSTEDLQKIFSYIASYLEKLMDSRRLTIDEADEFIREIFLRTTGAKIERIGKISNPMGYDRDEDLHKHCCPDCGEIWEHRSSDACFKYDAHNCPKCGTEQYIKYHP